jgi:hypothetical protein
MVGHGREANADAMIQELVKECGDYFAELLEKYAGRVAPELDLETVRMIADKIRQLDFGPQLVIGNIVENTFGGEEAARYVIALVTKKAH